jgi:phage/plasmid primase-like uncharacterized protein
MTHQSVVICDDDMVHETNKAGKQAAKHAALHACAATAIPAIVVVDGSESNTANARWFPRPGPAQLEIQKGSRPEHAVRCVRACHGSSLQAAPRKCPSLC